MFTHLNIIIKGNVTDKSIKTPPPFGGQLGELKCSSVYMISYTKYIFNIEKSASITI
jgi:hypothetical protein